MSRFSRMSPTEACQAGSFKAKPHPAKKLSPKISHGLTKPSPTERASAVDASAIRQCPASITPRRLKLSAIAPARIDKKKAGSVDAACTSATIRSEAEIVAISQLIATLCTSQPRLDICVAVQIERKTGF
ncbi:hypothetical protein X759_30095 [Mesorhizobium sp. LSHC420B00]|nr:hypothetical protein X759_30095 [Mesorhizobium sp. LSHC420B00]